MTRIGNVAYSAIQVDGHQHLFLVAATNIQNAVCKNRRRNNIRGHAAALP